MKKFILCAALAVGEGLAALNPELYASWPFWAFAALLVGLLGFGYAWRGWPCLFLIFAGAALFYAASSDRERTNQASPWLRRSPRKTMRSSSVGEPGAFRLARVKASLSRRVGLGLPARSETAALNRAILLGERARLSRATKRAFVESGTVHVFAISGLHVMIVARVLMFFAALLFVPSRWQGVAALPVLWGYVAVIGSPPSAVRAAAMATILFLSPVFWRRPDGLSAWALTFLTVHVLNPTQIADVGSLFSFSVMLALLVTGRVGSWLPPWGQNVCASVAAWAAGVPIAAVVFGQMTPGALLANVVLLPTAAVAVGAGVCGIVASFVSETLAAHVNCFAALFTEAMSFFSAAVASIPGSCLRLPAWGPCEVLLWYVALALSLLLLRLRGNSRSLV